jgi:uncharacterized membrane protein YGL010W
MPVRMHRRPASLEAAMKRVDMFLADYASYHRTRGNIACHFVGVPTIIYGALGILRLFNVADHGALAHVTGAEVLIALATVFYLTLDIRLALGMLLFAAGAGVLAAVVDNWIVALAAFVIGWIAQGIGHAVYEKRSPAFFTNLVHLLIGPLFLLNEALHVRRVAV